MPKTKIGLFSCFAAPKEESEISPLLEKINPISIPKLNKEILELIDKLKISNTNKQLLRDMYTKGSVLLENYLKLNEQEKILLGFISGITKQITEKKFLEPEILTGLITKYAEMSEKIDWSKFQSISPAILIAPVQAQNSTGISLSSSQLSAVKLKPVNKITIQEHAQTAKQENGKAAWVVKPDDLARNKLKPVQK